MIVTSLHLLVVGCTCGSLAGPTAFLRGNCMQEDLIFMQMRRYKRLDRFELFN